MPRRFKNEKYNSLPSIEKVFKAEATSEDVTKLTIYGDIGDSWWGESISATAVEKAIKDVTTKIIEVHINSFGGDAFDGITIYRQLKDHQADIEIHVDGLAASAASIIAMAGDKVIMNTGSMMMIHEAATMAWGTKTEIKKTVNALEGLDESLADIYMTRFNGEQSEIDDIMLAETWLTAREAIEKGFADKIEVEEIPDDDDVTNETEKLKAMIDEMKNEIAAIKNSAKPKEPTPDPAPKQNLSSLFLNLK